jgi:hypothetical protein
MTLPEQILVRRRLQILGHGAAPEKRALDLLEKDDRWVTDFMERFAKIIRNIGRRK